MLLTEQIHGFEDEPAAQLKIIMSLCHDLIAGQIIWFFFGLWQNSSPDKQNLCFFALCNEQSKWLRLKSRELHYNKKMQEAYPMKRLVMSSQVESSHV